MLDLFLPERCVHCEKPSIHSVTGNKENLLAHYICGVCQRILDNQEQPKDEYVRNKLDVVASKLDLASCCAAYTFIPDSPIQSIIHSFKYSGMKRLANNLGMGISALVPIETSFIIPVPLHRTRMAERGYNQADALARGITKRSNCRIINAVKRVRPTPSQTNLTVPERIENVRAAFALIRHSEAIKGQHVLIVDDVMTTGSTLASVVETIIEAKPKSVSILALAAVTLI